MGLRSAALVAALPWAAAASYETKWYTQSLTHAKGDDRTYQQRYLVNDTFWGKGSAPLWRDDDSCPGPVLFYSGNEGPVDGFWPANGFMTDYLAPKWGAMYSVHSAGRRPCTGPRRPGLRTTSVLRRRRP